MHKKPTARHNKVNISDRKARLIVDLVRGLSVAKACAILKYTPHKASPLVYKLLTNAVNNWQQTKKQTNISKELLYIKKIWVDGGRMLKRIQPAPQGRAHRIRKRSAHISVLLDQMNSKAPTSSKPKKEAVKNPDKKPQTS